MKRYISSLLTLLLVVLALSPSHALPSEAQALSQLEENIELTQSATAKPADQKIYCTATIDDDFTDNEVLVVINNSASKINKKFEKGHFGNIGIQSIEDLTSLPEDADFEELGVNENTYQQILLLTLDTHSKENVLKVIKKLEKHKDVESAEPNMFSEPCAVSGGDPEFAKQAAALQAMHIPDAWSFTTGSSAVKVGVIDSGIETHEDLNFNVTTGYDFVNENTITNDPIKEHGTHVAGIIGASGGNGFGVTGVCWDVTLVPLQVELPSGSWSGTAVVKAIQYATVNNIPILNYSGGNQSENNNRKTAIDNYPGLLVTVAGNKGENIDNEATPQYPACYDCENIIVVAAATVNDTLWHGTDYSSNYGETSVDLAAIGEGIYSCVSDNEYNYKNGTSMAVPFVSGVAALIKSVRPDLTALEIKHIILSSVDQKDYLDGKVATGGLLNANDALSMAMDYPTNMVSGHFDNDDDADEELACFYPWNGGKTKLCIYDLNDPMATCTTITCNELVYDNIDGRVVVGDFDGDNLDEIGVFYDKGATSGGQTTELWVFQQPLTSSSYYYNKAHSSTTYNANNVTGRITAGDYNGDGKDEIVAIYDNGNQIKFWELRYQSSANYHSSTVFTSTTLNASAMTGRVTSADFDQDGFEDIAVIYDGGRLPSNAYITSVMLFKGASNNTFTHVTACSVMGMNANNFSGIVCHDFDGITDGNARPDIQGMYAQTNGFGIYRFSNTTGTAFSAGWVN